MKIKLYNIQDNLDILQEVHYQLEKFRQTKPFKDIRNLLKQILMMNQEHVSQVINFKIVNGNQVA